MYAAVLACLHVTRVVSEIRVFAVLNDQPAVFFQHTGVKNDVGQGRKLLQRIGRVGKDEVVFGVARTQELEHVTANERQIADSECLAATDDPVLLYVRQFDGRYTAGAATDTLDTDASCAGKQIEHIDALKIHPVVEQVEQALLGKVSRGPCGDIFRGRQSPPPICSGDNTHLSNR